MTMMYSIKEMRMNMLILLDMVLSSDEISL